MTGFPGGSAVKNLPTNAGDAGSIPESGRSPEEGNGNPLSILAWEISWTEEPGGLQFMGLQRVRHDLATKQQRLGNTRIWHRFLPFVHLFIHSGKL